VFHQDTLSNENGILYDESLKYMGADWGQGFILLAIKLI